MKKKPILAAVACLILIFSALAAFAEPVSYYTEDVGFSVEIPDSFQVVWRGMSPDDPVLDRIGLYYDDAMSILESNESYLEAFTESGMVYITIMVYDTTIPDFSEFSEADFEAYADEYAEEVKEYDISYSHHEKYEHPQTPFIMFRGYNGVFGSNSITYNTIYEGKEIYVSLFARDQISSYLESMIKDVVDSMVFNEKADKGIASNKSYLWLYIATAAVIPVILIIFFSHKKAQADKEDVAPHYDPNGTDGGGMIS